VSASPEVLYIDWPMISDIIFVYLKTGLFMRKPFHFHFEKEIRLEQSFGGGTQCESDTLMDFMEPLLG